MKAVYAACLTRKEEGGFRAVVPDVPGCVTSGADLAETLDMIADALHGCLCVLEDEHQPIPAWMDRLVQKNGVNCSQVLQEALRARFTHT